MFFSDLVIAEYHANLTCDVCCKPLIEVDEFEQGTDFHSIVATLYCETCKSILTIK